MQQTQSTTSETRLPQALQGILPRGDVQAFWAEVARIGTPIVEPIAGESRYRATFLARGDENTTSFTATGGAFYWKETPFAQLPNTNIWIAQVEVPYGQVGSYVILKNLPPGTDYWEQRKFCFRDEFSAHQTLNWKAWPKASGAPYSTHVLEAPGAIAATYLDKPDESTTGQRIEVRFSSKILGNERDLFTYLPRDFEPGIPLPTLLVFDGSSYFNGMAVPTMLDNMIAAGVIPPVAALFPCSIDTPTRNKELPCNPEFLRMLTDELLPFAERTYGVNTADQSIVLAGSSYGGLAALYGGIMRPDKFTHVLSQSGAVYWALGDDYSQGHSWLPKELERNGKLPQKLYFDAGTSDNVFTSEGKHPHILDANRALHEQLERMHFERSKYLEFAGGHDYACWQRTFPIGLAWLLGEQS